MFGKISSAAVAVIGGLCAIAPAAQITHSLSQTIDPGASVACTNGVSTFDNAFLRSFDLTAFIGAGNNFNVTSVDIGVSEINADFPLNINIYLDADGGDPTLYGGDLSLLSTTPTVLHPGDAGTVVNVPVSQLVSAGSFMVVEAHYGFVGDGAILFLGANSLGQTGPTYVASVDCGIPEPLDLALIGFPDTHGVMNVNGRIEAAGIPTPSAAFGGLALLGGLGVTALRRRARR